jgi:predicted Rossmann-fold nucleotide-binding protein
VSELARRLAALIEGKTPAILCCGCLAGHLMASEDAVREAAQLLVMSVSDRYETVERRCAQCGERDSMVRLLA